MSEFKLKNCPWCGKQPRLWLVKDRDFCYIDCSNKKCLIHPGTLTAELPEVAIKIWNTRKGE